MIAIKKSMTLTIEGDKDLQILSKIIELGESALEEVDKESWGNDLPLALDLCKRLTKVLNEYSHLGVGAAHIVESLRG